MSNIQRTTQPIWSGVLGGIAEHFDVDPFFIRFGYVIFSAFTGCLMGLILYWVMTLLIPKQKRIDAPPPLDVMLNAKSNTVATSPRPTRKPRVRKANRK